MRDGVAEQDGGQVGGSHAAHGPGAVAAGASQSELGVLYAVAEALNSVADVRQALERTLALVADRLGLRTGWVWLLDPETDQFYSAAAHNLPPYLQEPVRMTGRWCECIGAFQEGDLSPRNVDVIECTRLAPAVRAQDNALTEGLRYHATIPLTFQDKALGIMNVTGPSWRRLTSEELRLLSTIAYQVGIAIERARLAEERARLARAEERARLAREIHDTLAQGLTAIGLQVESALRTLEEDPARARQRLERALATTRESLDEARRSVEDLRAEPLAGRPLAEALAALARTFTSDTGIRVHVRTIGARALNAPGSSDHPGVVPLRCEAELYRIAQEALANVRQHARAQEVEITLRVTPRAVRLTIHDDGRGLPAAASGTAGTSQKDHLGPAAGRGHGIPGMHERARLLSGSLQIASRAGRGTTVTATIPRSADGTPGDSG